MIGEACLITTFDPFANTIELEMSAEEQALVEAFAVSLEEQGFTFPPPDDDPFQVTASQSFVAPSAMELEEAAAVIRATAVVVETVVAPVVAPIVTPVIAPVIAPVVAPVPIVVQEVAVPGLDTNGVQQVSQLSGSFSEPGADIRDFGVGVVQEPLAASGAIRPTSIAGLAVRLLMVLLGRATVVTARMWGQLPGWAQAALAGIGVGVGTDMALRRDIPFITLPGQGGGEIAPTGGMFPEVMGHNDIPGVHLGAHVIGSWVANGVRFYRLSDGKLAVQNKAGRWKVWRPKKPIVLMPGGATNLKTLLRADAMLNRQAKRIARMLARRAPSRARKPTEAKTVVIEAHGRLAN